MNRERRGRAAWFLGLAVGAAATLTLASCTSSKGGPAQGASDATTPEGSSGEDEASARDAGTPADSAHDLVADGTSESSTDAPASMDGGADASDSAFDGALDGARDGSTCVPVDAEVLDGSAEEAGYALTHMTSTFFPSAISDCYGCHGPTFSGGLIVHGAYAKNLTPDPATGLGCWTDQQIVTAILTATAADGEMLCVMPKWGELGMNADQAEQIVEYLRSLPAVVNQVPPTNCPGPADAGGEAGDAGEE